MAKQTINIGASPNDGTGTPLRTAFDYTNQNFTELYTATGPSGNNIVVPGTATITGDLTVDTSTLKVDSANNRVGIVNASPAYPLDVTGIINSSSDIYAQGGRLALYRSAGASYFDWSTSQDLVWRQVTSVGGAGASTLMTLNATGLGVGTSPAVLLDIQSASAVIRATSSTGTNTSFAAFGNTGGAVRVGAENSAGGGLFTGSSAYSAVLGTTGAYSAHIGTNGVVRATVDATGNVGIGVTPSVWNSGYKALQVGGGAALFNNTSGSNSAWLTSNFFFDSSNANTFIGTGYALMYRQTSGEHAWLTSTASGTAGAAATMTQAMTLDESGNLLLGTTTMPSGVTFARLVAKSDLSDWSGVIWNSNAIPYGFRIQHDTDSNGTGNEFLYCLGAANLRASIRSNGGIANYQANDVSLSDSRMKSDIKPLGSYWNKIKSLEIVTFKYNDQTHSDDNIGLIAQQVESVAPELVDVDGFGETPADGVPLKTIYTTDLYHAAIKALQEAMARIEVLEAKLA